MPDPTLDIEQLLRSVLDSNTRIENSLKQKERDEKIIKWLTLAATIFSAVLIGLLTAFITWRLGEQTQALQQAAAAQSQIHDLSSEDPNVRYGAERFLAETRYADLVLRQASEFGDIDSIRMLGLDSSTNRGMQQKYKNADIILSNEMEQDKKCFAGQWQQDYINKEKKILRSWTVQIIGPRRLSVFRGGDDGGISIRARKIDKNFWMDPHFSYGDRIAPLKLTVPDDCSAMDSNWNWHIYKVIPGLSPTSGDQAGPTMPQ